MRKLIFTLLSVFLTTVALAAPDATPPTLYHKLFADAQRLSGLDCSKMNHADAYCHPVTIVIKPFDEPGVLGQYEPGTYQIQVTPLLDPGSLEFQVVIVHEYTHYLQYLSGKLLPGDTCMDRYEAEKQAYATGDAYELENKGPDERDDHAFFLLTYKMQCSGTDGLYP